METTLLNDIDQIDKKHEAKKRAKWVEKLIDMPDLRVEHLPPEIPSASPPVLAEVAKKILADML